MGNNYSNYKKKKENDENYIIMIGLLFILTPYYKNYQERLKFDETYRFLSSIPKRNTIYISGNLKRHHVSMYKFIDDQKKIINIHKVRLDYEKKELYLCNINLFMNPVCLMYLIEFGKCNTLELDFDDIDKDKIEIYINLIYQHLINRVSTLIIHKYLLLNDNLKNNKFIKKIYFNNVLRDYKSETLKLEQFNNIKFKKEIFVEYY
jgi:hypothetical protein